MDETYIKVKGQRRYLYRTVDKQGNTVDLLFFSLKYALEYKRAASITQVHL